MTTLSVERTPGMRWICSEQDVAKCRDVLGAGDQHQVEPTGAHRQVLDAGDRRELGAQGSPVVLLDVDEHQRGDAEPEGLGVDGGSEAGDDVLVAQPLQASVGCRPRHVDLLGEVGQRDSGVHRDGGNHGAIDAVDLSVGRLDPSRSIRRFASYQTPNRVNSSRFLQVLDTSSDLER